MNSFSDCRRINAEGHSVWRVRTEEEIETTFYENIEIAQNGCWTWIKGKNKSGYGYFFALGEDLVHRVAWRLFYGPIPHGICVLHSCDNPPCCRPSHLFLGTQTDNTKDMRAKKRSWITPFKLTFEQAEEIRSRYVPGNGRRYVPGAVTMEMLANEFGVAAYMIHRIIHEKIHKRPV